MSGKHVILKKHQAVAIVVGTILSLLSALPVFLFLIRYTRTEKGGRSALEVLMMLGDPRYVHVCICPTIGLSVAAFIVFLSFLRAEKRD